MRKPIFIATFRFHPENDDHARQIRDKFEQNLGGDYHVFVVFTDPYDCGTHEPKFQLFSDREIKPIELEKLRQMVLNN